MMNPVFDESAYGNLLANVVPKIIDTEEEYDRLLVIAEQLTFKKNRTLEEHALHKLLVVLIEVHEAQNYLMEQVAPHEALQHILESSGTHQSVLVGVIGSSDLVTEVVNGKRSISKVQAKKLGDYFGVPPSLFV